MNKISIMLATVLVVLFVCTFSFSVISFLIWVGVGLLWVGVGLLNLFGLNIKFSFEFCFIVWIVLSTIRFVNSICKR